MREPVRFALSAVLIVAGSACDITIPWATARPDQRGGQPGAGERRRLERLGAALGLYFFNYMARSSTFRIMNGFYSRIMARMVNEGFARVQSFSTDWHASNFAGATVRRVSRAMWGYDSASDALLLMLVPTLIVMCGLSVSIGLRWPLAGAVRGRPGERSSRSTTWCWR